MCSLPTIYRPLGRQAACFTLHAAYFTSICSFVRQCFRKWLPVPLPTQHPTYATIVAASLAQCTTVASKKDRVRKRDKILVLQGPINDTNDTNDSNGTNHPYPRAAVTYPFIRVKTLSSATNLSIVRAFLIHCLVCVCVCVFFPSILDIKFVGRTSRGHTGGRSHRIFNPPSFCGACLDFCREKDSAIPFPRRP